MTDLKRSPQSGPQKPPVEEDYRVLPASAGKLWLTESWQFLRANQRPIMVAVLFLGLIWSLAGVPILGVVISVLTPVFTAGLLLGIRGGFGKKISQINLFAGWDQAGPRKQLVYLGLLMVAVSLLVATLVGPDLTALQEAIVAGNVPLVSFERVIIIFTLGYTLVGFTTWLALPEIAITGRPVLAALILSLRATMANWRALTMLGLWLMAAWLVAIFVVSMFSALLLSLLGTYVGGFLATIPILILWLFLVALMFVLQYVCWRDILGDTELENDSQRQQSKNAEEEQTRVII